MLDACRSKYYARRQRDRESLLALSDRRLLVLIRSLHEEWDGILGYRRMRARLRQEFEKSMDIQRVRQLMRSAGLSGVPKKRRPYRKPSQTDKIPPICCNASSRRGSRI
ncbi:MAG: IS3 family transposase [Gammaproteobacteria bacterium]|nr:IS3 family transposase [Gammaproteobacteria bacterium]